MHRKLILKSASKQGFSLVEILLTLALLSVSILPITLLLQQLGFNSKGNYLASSRSMLINSLAEEIDPENPNFYSDYNDATVQTITESGTLIGYMRKVDTAASNALKRRVHFYLCRQTSGATCTPIYQASWDYVLEELRLNCGAVANTPYVDDSGQLWIPDAFSYDGVNKVEGYSGSRTATDNLALGNVITNTANDTLYLTTSQVTSTTLADSLTYRFDVDNGNYLVKLYFAELNASSITRYTDISIEGSKVLDDYSPSAAIGSVRKAEVKSYTTSVSDNVLDIKVENGGAANPVANRARIMAIAIRRRP